MLAERPHGLLDGVGASVAAWLLLVQDQHVQVCRPSNISCDDAPLASDEANPKTRIPRPLCRVPSPPADQFADVRAPIVGAVIRPLQGRLRFP